MDTKELDIANVDYDKMVKDHPILRDILPKNVMDQMVNSDKATRKNISGEWATNAKENWKHHIRKHGWVNEGFKGLGVGKAAIAIGSGPSLAKNFDVLKMLSLTDGTRPFEDQDFIFIASNHETKPCFENGIIPHFCMVADSSAKLVSQFDVGKDAKHTFLLCSINACPDIVDKWPGKVRFIAPRNDLAINFLQKVMKGKFDEKRTVIEGGNIINLSFSLAMGLFDTSVWMCVGNDLSFPIKKTIKEQRAAYYRDGDYSTNLASNRDEARYPLIWGGFRFSESNIITPNNTKLVTLDKVLTSPQMFVYKTWLEANASMLWNFGKKMVIYNCTEGGILGVNLKESAVGKQNVEAKFDKDSWFLLDEKMRGKWRTRKLIDAAEEFHKGKETWIQLNRQRILQP